MSQIKYAVQRAWRIDLFRSFLTILIGMYAFNKIFVTTITVVIVLIGCERNAAQYEYTSTQPQLTFHRPADGKLGENQVADYVVIRQKIIHDVNAQKAARSMTQAETAKDPTISTSERHFDEIEKAAALSFNMSYAEFLWIKDTVISTQTALLLQQYYDLNNKIMVLLDETLTRYQETSASNKDRHEQLTMDGYIEEMRQELDGLSQKTTDPGKRPETLQHNINIILQFKNELDSLEQKTLSPSAYR